MVMLKIVSAPISIPLFQTSAPAGVIFLQYIRHVLCGMALPLKQGALETGSPSGFAGFSTISTFTGGNSLKKENNATENLLPKKKFRIPYQNIIVGAAAFAYFFTLQTDQVLATDMWSKADTILKDVYGKILGISTIAAIVTASVALLLMNFSKSGRTVDESRAWLKRIAISWVILNGLGFILAYVTPFFSDGKWNG